MDEGTVGIFVLVGISIGAALLFHWLIRSYIIASFGAAIVADIVFQVAAYLHIGYLDPFFVIALVTGGGIALGIAIVVGIPFAIFRLTIKVDHAG